MDPVFPLTDLNVHPGPLGLSKRELFAAMAMHGWLSDSKNTATLVYDYEPKQLPATVSLICVGFADALIAELEKNK